MGAFKAIAIDIEELEQKQESPATKEQINQITQDHINYRKEYSEYIDEQNTIQGDALEEICTKAEKRLGLYGYGDKFNVEYESQKNYEFQAGVNASDLNKDCIEWLASKGVVIDERDEETFIVEGNFSISFDDDIPLAEIDCIVLTYGSDYFDIKEFIKCDEKLCEDIEQSGDVLDWMSDAEAARGDAMYDSWKDDQMERADYMHDQRKDDKMERADEE